MDGDRELVAVCLEFLVGAADDFALEEVRLDEEVHAHNVHRDSNGGRHRVADEVIDR